MKTIFKNILFWTIGLGPILGFCICFTGCSVLNKVPDINESTAQEAANFIKERSGFIQDGIATLIRIVIPNIEDGEDKQHYINVINGVASQLNGLLVNGKFDAESIRKAFQVNHPILDPGLRLAADLLVVEINKLKKDGYGDFAVALITAATKGIADGTAGY